MRACVSAQERQAYGYSANAAVVAVVGLEELQEAETESAKVDGMRRRFICSG